MFDSRQCRLFPCICFYARSAHTHLLLFAFVREHSPAIEHESVGGHLVIELEPLHFWKGNQHQCQVAAKLVLFLATTIFGFGTDLLGGCDGREH